MDVSLAAKGRGVKAFQAGLFEDAVREFTDAITKASSDEALDALHTFHGNRCASYQHLQLFDKASEDAEACTQIKPTWSKGWAHLGNCKSHLGLYSEAASAYRKVCELEPHKAGEYRTMAEKAEQKFKARRPPSAASTPGILQFALWGIIFMNATMYLFSFTANRASLQKMNRNVVMFYLVSAFTSFHQRHGLPTFTKIGLMDYMKKAIIENALQRVFGALLLFMGSNPVALIALLLPELANFAAGLVAKLRQYKVLRMADMIAKLLEGKLLDRSGAPYWKVSQYSAYAEVAAGVTLIVSLLTPRRNIILLVLYWQYLQMRFLIEVATGMTVGVLHQAFAELDRRILTVVMKLPSPILYGYNMLKGLLARQVKLPDPNQPSLSSSLASKCTVM